MTAERAKEILYYEWQDFLENNMDYAGVSDAYKLAFKALEQLTIIEDIRAEITEISVEEIREDEKWARGLHYALKIIDKHLHN